MADAARKFRCNLLIYFLYILSLLRCVQLQVPFDAEDQGKGLVYESYLYPGLHPSELVTEYEIFHYLTERGAIYAGVPPMIHYDNTTQIVDTELYFISIADVDEIQMQYEATFLMKETWFDRRFKYDKYNRAEQYIVSHSRESYYHWKPDTYFLTEREAIRHQNTQNNLGVMFYRDGTVWYIQKLTMTMDCQMKLHRFPLDTQECEIDSSSYALTTSFLHYQWAKQTSNPHGHPVEVNEDIQLSEFKIVGVKHSEHDLNRFTGIYSSLKVILVMERQMSYYWMQVYIPSGLAVMLSWVSFYIDQGAVPARISLGLLTILTMTTQIYGINSQLPRVSYIKAIDVWMLICLVMVIAAMFEFSMVHMLARKIRIGMQTGAIYPGHPNFPGYVDPNEEPAVGLRGYWLAKFRRYRRSPPLFVDVVSRIAFPLAFIFLNFVYWIYYLFIFDKNPE